jgi:hypothetical protein
VTTVRLIHWHEEEARERAGRLESLGYTVDSDQLAGPGMRDLRESPPDAVVIDLGRLPSHGRDVGVGFRSYKDTRRVPLVYVGGEPKKVARVRELLPDATYTDWEAIADDLAAAIENPPSSPVVPSSRMAGYSGTPLPQKLGIKADSVVVLVDAPPEFEKTLGDIPDGAVLRRGPDRLGDVTLWFTTERSQLETRIAGMHESAERGRLWIVWPKKSSGVASDLTQQAVREIGLASGLVDYKIAAVDETWSGLCFTARKQG